jgi:hypothetical protein
MALPHFQVAASLLSAVIFHHNLRLHGRFITTLRSTGAEYVTPLATRFETLKDFFTKGSIAAHDRAQEYKDTARKEHYEILSSLLDEACLI